MQVNMKPGTKNLIVETHNPRFFRFMPCDDITSVEAAWLAHFFASITFSPVEDYEAWSIIQRHFEEGE